MSDILKTLTSHGFLRPTSLKVKKKEFIMWPKSYKDYKTDAPLIKLQVSPQKGIIGCEMHELNGWGEEHHLPQKQKKGMISTLLEAFFSFLIPKVIR
jgi:hypothetical protein